MTSDMHLPPEKRRQLPHMVWASVFPDIRYDKASPSHLLTSVDKQLLPKTATLPVLCYICLNSLLVPPCCRHFPESSVHLTRGLRAGISWLHGSLALGPPPQAELRAPHGSSPHPSAASEQVADWKARLFLHGLDRSSVHHVVLSNWTCWPWGGLRFRSEAHCDHVSGCHRVCRLHCPLHRAKRPDLILFPGSRCNDG